MRITLGSISYDCIRAVRNADSATLHLRDGSCIELSQISNWDAIRIENGDWETPNPYGGLEFDQSRKVTTMASTIYVARLIASGQAVDTDDKRLRASGLYADWAPGDHPKGEIYNADGQTWEVFQPYDNAVYPDIRPGEAAWYTFNRPLHGTSPETARPFVSVQGAHDMYRAGEYMTLGGALYQCVEDTNFPPEEYPQAWELVSTLDAGSPEEGGQKEIISNLGVRAEK